MSERQSGQAIHPTTKPCRTVAEAHLNAVLEETTPAAKPATRTEYLAMMSAAIDNLGLNLEGGL